MLIETKVGLDNVVPTMVLKVVQVLRSKMEARLAKRQYRANMAAFHGRQNVVVPCLVMEARLAKRHYCANIGSTSGARAGAVVRQPCLLMQRKMGLYNSVPLFVISW